MHWSDRRVLVTGGAGFVGSHLTRDLLERGASVRVVDNFFAGREALVPDGATMVDLDVRSDALAVDVARFDPDVVVHLAAIHYVPYCDEHPEEAFDVNVVGTRNLLAALRECESLERIVYASSAAVYPPRDEPLSEDGPVGPIDVYGKTKLVGEDLVAGFEAETGVRARSARLFNVYGPDETNPHLIPAILEQLDDGGRSVELGNLEPRRDFVHVSDVSRALQALAAYDGEHRTFNVGTGEAHSVREVVEATRDALGEDLEISQDPERVRDSDRVHLQADRSRLTAETGWEPTVSLEAGIAALLERCRVVA